MTSYQRPQRPSYWPWTITALIITAVILASCWVRVWGHK